MGIPSSHSSLKCPQYRGFGSYGSGSTGVGGAAQVVCISEEKSAAEGADIVRVDCTSLEGSSVKKAETRCGSTAGGGDLSVAVDCTSCEGSSAGRRMMGAAGGFSTKPPFACGEQAGGSCDTHSVFDVKLIESSKMERKQSGPGGAMRNSNMVRRVVRARRRQYRARHMRNCRGVYAWKVATPEVMRHMVALVQCVSVLADVPLCRRSSLHIRADLRSKLAEALASGEKEKAFAKQCGFSSKPRADDPRAMMQAFPNAQDIAYDCEPVASGINASLWRFWHARHCSRCTQEAVHDACYFKPLHHFLKTGFELPVKRGFDIYAAQPTRVAYVDKWREEEARCKRAFKKWEDDSSGLMSPVVSSVPRLVFPLLPVVRAKDAWRHRRTGEDYKVRLCVDFKNGGFNDMLEEWPFRYWGLESVAETVSSGDWLASIDISRFYLRLPAGKQLRSAQWFQDPESFAGDTHANERISEAKRRFRQLRSVAFGLKSAPAFASAVSAEAKRILESFGISVAGVYIDDFLIRAASKEECAASLRKATAILTALGIPPNDKTQGPCAPGEGITFLGVRIRTDTCSMSVTAEHRRYSVARVEQVLRRGEVSLKELESIAGILSWIAHVYVPGRPRRDALFASMGRMKKKGQHKMVIRGELKRQLLWWLNAMRGDKIPSSTHFWDKQPEVPLMVSDASGEDGWGACVQGLHIVGAWPEEWKQSAGEGAPGMLFKELVPIVVSVLLIAPFCEGKVIAAATDNAGVAFVLNAMSCRCPWSLALLRPLADTLAKYRLGLVAGHAHRAHNTHADDLSHALPQAVWKKLRVVAKSARQGLQFVVHDMQFHEAFTASMSFPRASSVGATGAL